MSLLERVKTAQNQKVMDRFQPCHFWSAHHKLWSRIPIYCLVPPPQGSKLRWREDMSGGLPSAWKSHTGWSLQTGHTAQGVLPYVRLFDTSGCKSLYRQYPYFRTTKSPTMVRFNTYAWPILINTQANGGSRQYIWAKPCKRTLKRRNKIAWWSFLPSLPFYHPQTKCPTVSLINSLQIVFWLICNSLSNGRLTGASLWLKDCLNCLTKLQTD